jgi:hypothetical protein
MLDKYPSITPATSAFKPTIDSFIANSQLLLDIFTINQYSLATTIQLEQTISAQSPSASQPSYIVSIKSLLPANFWSIQVLLSRKDSPLNNFEVKVAAYVAAASGKSHLPLGWLA